MFFISVNICNSQKRFSHQSSMKKINTEKPFVIGLSNQCLEELLNVCSYNCMNGNQTLNAFALYKFHLKWGAPVSDAAQSYQNAKYNQWMLDKIFILFYISDRDWMNSNFSQLGVRYEYITQLSEFILSHSEEIKLRDQLYDNPQSDEHESLDNKAEDKEEVFEVIEQMPQFPGGEAALLGFINKNLIYPAKAAENFIQGKVIIHFIVSKTGEVTKVNVKQSLDSLCDEEAIRVIKMLPKFEPAKQHGKNVSAWYTLPFTFKLE